MFAKFTKDKNHDGKISQNRKENHFQGQYTTVVYDHVKREILELAILRLYSTNASSYACLWLRDSRNQNYASGGGRAIGYGYHKPSAAAQAAMLDAGIVLSEDIAGRGYRAVEDAMKAIGLAMGYSKVQVLEAHS